MARSVTPFMTLRRFLLWLLALLVLLVFAGAWYARVAWEEWRQLNNVRNFQWQGVALSLSGVQVERFSISQLRNGQPYVAEGKELSLGWSWHWHGPMPDVVRVGRLTVDIPAWPGSGEQGESEGFARDLPLWLPDAISVEQLVLSLPEGIRVEGDLAVTRLSVPDEREMVTDSMNIEAPIGGMNMAGWQLNEGRAKLLFAGRANEESATLDFRENAHLEFSGVDAPDDTVRLDKLSIKLAGWELTAGYSLQPMVLESLDYGGRASLTTAAVHHSQLYSQPWRLDGRVDGTLESLSFDGRLSSDAGTAADIDLSFPFDGIPELDVEMAATGKSGGQALADTFTAWPGELEIGEGGIRTTLSLSFPPEGTRVQGEMDFESLGGLYARTAWAGLNGKATIDLTGNRLDARTPSLALDTVNPGIALSNIQVAGRYRSTTEQPAAGDLTLDRATAELLGGRVRVDPGQWQLSQMPLRVPLELTGIELTQLMQVYPAEGLAGSGVLQGTVPLRISGQGLSIDSGQVEAMAPGGTLKLPADQLRGMAQGNEAMTLVVRAMQNFNYSVLTSTIDYAQDGTLALGLRLEGSSPDVRDGHPIVLNINLEEDIPALLTSLQLSGRVNEAVTEKVRNLMQKRDVERQSTELGN